MIILEQGNRGVSNELLSTLAEQKTKIEFI